MIDTAALWIGYAFMIGAIVCSLIGLVGIIINWAWGRMKDFYAWAWLCVAVRQFNRKHPNSPLRTWLDEDARK